MEKAEILTNAAGLSLGAIQTIDYSWGEIKKEVRPVDRGLTSPSDVPCDMAIEPDDIEIADTVTVVWEIT